MKVLLCCLLVVSFPVCADDSEVSVIALLTGLEEFQWFENDGESTSDGVAPLASFVVLEPIELAGEGVSILFKYGVPDAAPESMLAGGVYRFTVPGDFFGSGAEILENMDISGFALLSGGDE